MVKKITVSEGDKFGFWTIIKLEKTPDNDKGHVYYECKCKCGKSQILSISKLKRQISTQCKSCSAFVLSQKRQLSKIGKTVHDWTFIELVEHRYERNRPLYKMRHMCGYEFTPADCYKISNVRCWDCPPKPRKPYEKGKK